VEQTAVGRPEDVVPPVEVDGGSSTMMEVDHVAGLMEGCRPGGTWTKRPK
jgi:hypothetical protein